MMTVSAWRTEGLHLPWSGDPMAPFRQQDRVFGRLLLIFAAVLLALSVVISMLTVPPLSVPMSRASEVMSARLLLDDPLPEPQPVTVTEPEPEVVATQPVVTELVPEVVPEPVPTARERALASGVLQFADELRAMRQAPVSTELASNQLTDGSEQAENALRETLTATAREPEIRTRSGGVDTSVMREDVGGVALAARATGSVSRQWDVNADYVPRQGQRQSAVSDRSDEEIRRVMDQNKGAIYAIYNRALRKNPLLRGKLTIELVINSDGVIETLQLVNSELGDSDLENKLVSRIRMIRFSEQSVASTRLSYSFDFLPG
ncbi:MAG: AgmX/PglI C-terminal domain-containing protein [Pseudomonadales bacterium]|nr:AgmX/PglI C-terminal domain-containing protein [Pseudomonadales bacterium]